MGREKSTDPKAKAERQKSLPAKRDAAYWGYDMGTYAEETLAKRTASTVDISYDLQKTAWKMIYTLVAYIAMPIAEAIQCTDSRAVQPAQDCY